MVLFSPEKRRLRGNLINVYKYPVLGLKQRELGSSQWCPVMRQEAMGQTETHIRKFHLNIRKISFFFSCDSNQTLLQVAKRSCRVWILGDIQNSSGHDPE